MTKFKDKTAWITGATSGIGEELTYQLNAQQAKLIISSRREDELLRVRDHCKYPENVTIQILDLEKAETFPGIVETIIKKTGGVDYLFNNGGVSQRANAHETSLEVDRQIMEINFFGNIALTKALLPHMIERKNGHIVITSSVAGKFGFFLRSAYSASKHALHGFYESLRLEQLTNNIKVTLIAPGFVHTKMSQNALSGDGNKHGVMDLHQRKGLTATVCADKILEAVIKEKEEVVFGKKESFGVLLKRYLPGLFRRMIRKQSPTG